MVAIEKEFQQCDAGAADGAVACGISRVSGRALRESQGKQPASKLIKALLQTVGVEDGLAECGVGVVPLSRFQEMDDAASGFRARTQMDKPFLPPDRVQGLGGDFAEAAGEVRSAKAAEAIFDCGAVVRIAGVQRRAHSGEDKEGHEVGLVKNVNAGEGGEVAAVASEAEIRIVGGLLAGVDAILDVEPLVEVGAEIYVGQIGDLLLAERLRAEGSGLNEKLRCVGTKRFAGETAAEEQVGGDLTAGVARTDVGWL